MRVGAHIFARVTQMNKKIVVFSHVFQFLYIPDISYQSESVLTNNDGVRVRQSQITRARKLAKYGKNIIFS